MKKESKNIIIHIGLPKTATTWFQKNFFPLVTNYNYVQPRESNELLVHPDPLGSRDFEEHWKTQERLLISNENFCGLARTNGFIKVGLANRLKDLFPEARIVIFIRNQLDMITSEYSWYLKNSGGNFSFNKFLNYKSPYPLNNINYKLFHLQYDKLIGIYSELFGKENVHIYLYEDFKTNSKAFIRAFANDLDIKTNVDAIDYNPINTRLRVGVVPIMRFLNLFTDSKIIHRHSLISIPYSSRYVTSFAEFINQFRVFGRKLSLKDLLSTKEITSINNNFRESNRSLINDFGLTGLKKYNYPL